MFKDILVAVDIEHLDDQQRVLEMAKELAVAHKSNLHVVSIVPDIGSSIVGYQFSESMRKKALEQVNIKLHNYVSDVVGDTCPVQHIVDTGKIYEEIIFLSKKLKIDLIVMGAHKPMIRDYLLGSNAARVARHADCSVFIVRETEDGDG